MLAGLSVLVVVAIALLIGACVLCGGLIILKRCAKHVSQFIGFYKWRRSVVVSGVGLINEVNQHWARLVLGWVTVCWWVYHLGM